MEVGGGRGLLVLSRKPPRRPLHRFITVTVDVTIDVTVVNPSQQATVAGAATTASHAITYVHQRKMRGAGEACRRQGITLMPVESLGGLGEGAVRVVRRLAGAKRAKRVKKAKKVRLR